MDWDPEEYPDRRARFVYQPKPLTIIDMISDILKRLWDYGPCILMFVAIGFLIWYSITV